MATIPLPALHVEGAPQQPNLLQMAAQAYGIRNAQQENQLRQQQVIGAQQENQQRQIQMDQTQAVNTAYHDALTVDDSGKPQVDTAALSKSLAASGHGSAIPSILKNVQEYQKSAADLDEVQQKIQTTASDSLGYLGAAIQKANYDPHLADLMIEQRLRTPGVPQQEAARLAQIRQSIQQDPNTLKTMVDQMVAQSPKQADFANQEKVANIRSQSLDKMEAQSWLTNNPTKADGTPNTLADYQQHKIDQQRESEISKETDPRVLRSKMNLQASEAQIQQTVKNGSAKDAGALLAGGFVAPSEITARANPSFLVQAVNEARKLQPDFNPQKAEADFNVAKSPGNLGFFGSAKSLTDKGGTLDQLIEAAKAIPQHEIPVFNTIDDAVKAASGSGPVAKYASILVGVSDDYSKVMGGGTGSDSSRAQAFQLAKMSASPDQRDNAIAGIRGAVGSQINSRIGNNRVLKNMYGQQADSGTSQQHSPGAKAGLPEGQTGTGSDGKKYVVKGGVWVAQQ